MTAPRRPAGPRVVVVGAGIIGLYAALQLTRRGCAVTLLEADARNQSAARAATPVAAGMLAPFAEALRAPSSHTGLMALGARALRQWRDAYGSIHPDLTFLRVGGALLLAEDDAQAAQLTAHQAVLAQAGVEASMLDANAAALRTPLGAVRAALAIGDEAVIDVGGAYRFLEAAFCAEGGSLVVGAEARAIDVANERVRGIVLENGRLDADAVVLACGAFAPASLTARAPALARVSPAAGQRLLLRYEAAPPDFPNLHAVDCYAAKVTPTVVVVGATTRTGSSDVSISKREEAALLQAARRFAPTLVGTARSAEAAAGVRPMSPDGAPLIGPSGPAGCFVAAGHGRNGWLLAPVTADIVADYVLGRPIDPLAASFHPDRFETIP